MIFALALAGKPACAAPDASSAVLTPAQRGKVVKQLVSKYGARLVHARYMQQNPVPVNWPGYEGLPTLRCTYTVHDRANNTSKTAQVVMLNAAPDKIANWVVTACEKVGTTQPLVDGEKLMKHILGQSGGQFPVTGVVYEDMEGDGYFDTFCFRNGVTVRVDGVEHRTTHPLSAKEIQASLTGPVVKVYTYGRIASTTPDQYRAAGGEADVGTNAHATIQWEETVGALYRKAWNSNDNELIDAWAKANL